MGKNREHKRGPGARIRNLRDRLLAWLVDARWFLRDALLAARSRWRALRWRPDVIIAGDPLSPVPALLADGLQQAFRRAAQEQEPVRVLIARIPGCSAEIRLHAVRRTLRITAPTLARPLERTLPPLHAGTAPAIFRLTPAGDGIRLELYPRNNAIAWRRV